MNAMCIDFDLFFLLFCLIYHISSTQWFEEKSQQVEALDVQLRKLHTSIEILSVHRKGEYFLQACDL